MTTAGRVHRKPKTRASGFEWQLADVLSWRPLVLLEAMHILAENPSDVAALTSARCHIREMMAPVAAVLGIDANSPLLVEEVAFILANRERLWSKPANAAGRPRRDEARVTLAVKVAIFVSEMQVRPENGRRLTDTACLKHSNFDRTIGKYSLGWKRKILGEGRELQGGVV